MPQYKYSSHTAHVWSLQLYYNLHIDQTLLHISLKNKLQNLFTIVVQYICQQQICPLKCHIYTTCQKYLNMHQWGSMPVGMPHMNPLPSTRWPEVLYTNNNDEDTDTNNANAGQLHKLSWPLVKSAKNQSLQEQCTPPKVWIIQIQYF